ncbi:MAG: L-seryl-tRNA(Sec) selenium transferase [Nitrospinota bacterium]|nr:L-seryl-tRNA(Sec) selenium transferase [Nitrospinota bacterium]
MKPPKDNIQTTLQNLPSVDEVFRKLDEIKGGDFSEKQITNCIRKCIEKHRELILQYTLKKDISSKKILQRIKESVIQELESDEEKSLRPVINATGIVIHTNLGRAPLSESACKSLLEVAKGYSNLELDLDSGKRGKREHSIESVLCKLTGAEDALVVNNNAAAVMFALKVMSKGKETIISRGELIEIGGSFRIPDIMKESGAELIEVGTTNKTYIKDYENAINRKTALLFKAHTSNFYISGFTNSPSREELSKLGKEKSLPILEDLGSGSLHQFSILSSEPTVMDSIKAGIDVVTFSGDKLLGGPQAGIIVGSKFWVNTMRKDPMMRMLRLDKLVITSLEKTLRSFLNPDKLVQEIPVFQILSQEKKTLFERAKKLLKLLDKKNKRNAIFSIDESIGQIGGGTMPSVKLESYSLIIQTKNNSPDFFSKNLRKSKTPVIARIKDDKICLDMLCIKDEDLKLVQQTIEQALSESYIS